MFIFNTFFEQCLVHLCSTLKEMLNLKYKKTHQHFKCIALNLKGLKFTSNDVS